MDLALTRGQPGGLAAIGRMVAGSPPHAVLLVGPASTGKTTLALDLAAGLLCSAADPARRPCRSCRGCRLVGSGNHPDLHRLAPEGPGGQVRLGDPHQPEPGTVRHLVGELALLPIEGGARVAIVEAAHRLNEDAQNALLKTLEEPPPGVTIVLCADDDEVLLPTVRSRCVRVRLGPLAARAVEQLLVERGVADAPTAARLGRLADGRPGLALAYAMAPGAVRRREALDRRLLDLLAADRRARLSGVRELLAEAGGLEEELRASRDRLSAPGVTPATGPAQADAAGSSEGQPAEGAAEGGTSRLAPALRRRAAATLLEAWTALARDLAVASLGGDRLLRDPSLLEELKTASGALPPGAVIVFLGRLERASELLDQNANPELLVDVLALAWPRPAAAA